jgi:uncharacterized protein YjeT (DUF2065 family)
MSGGSILTQLLVSTLVAFLFAGSLLGLALGIGLVLRAGVMLPFIHFMNHWVSARQVLTPLERPRQVRPLASSGARWFGALLIALGAFAAAILVAKLDPGAVANLFKVDARTSLVGILLDAIRWFLVAGSLAAVVIGIMLLCFPQAWRRVEARANRWYSTQELERAGDALRPSLDRLVEAFPRASGLVLLVLSVSAALACGMLLFGG